MSLIKAKYILFLLLFSGFYCSAQSKNSDSLFKIFRQNMEVSKLEMDNETTVSYYTFLINSSISDLEKLTEDSMPEIRTAMFTGLIYKKADTNLINKIIENHILDTTKFDKKGGCIVSTWTVINYMKFIMDFKPDSLELQRRLTSTLQKIKNEYRIIIAGEHHGYISKDSLLQLKSISSTIPNCKIISYDLSIISSDLSKGIKVYKTRNLITKRIRRHLKICPKGTLIYFENIKAMIKNKGPKTIPNKSFRIR